MPHIHDKIDFTVSLFIVHDQKVLLVHHRALKKWLPLGGHIELDEDPEVAALREAREESGLSIELIGERPPTTETGTRALIAPRFLDIHRISESHEHIGMIYSGSGWEYPRRRSEFSGADALFQSIATTSIGRGRKPRQDSSSRNRYILYGVNTPPLAAFG